MKASILKSSIASFIFLSFSVSASWGLQVTSGSLAQSSVGTSNLEVQVIPGLQDDEPKADQHLSYYFGRVAVNTRDFVTYRFSNKGDKPIVINDITIRGMAFSARDNCPKTLEAKATCLTRISFWPSFQSSYSGRLVWYTSDGNVILSLWGEGV